MPEYLTEDRFNRFEDKFDTFIQTSEHRLTQIETKQAHVGTIATWLAGIVATVVTAIILTFGRMFGRN